MFDVYAGIYHRNGDVGAVGQRMRLGQSKFRKRVLRGIALSQRRLLLLQEVTEIRLHPVNAGISGELAARCFHSAAVGDAEQADGSAQKWKILRLQTHETVSPRQFVSLRTGQRTVDLGAEMAWDRALTQRCLRHKCAADRCFWSFPSC